MKREKSEIIIYNNGEYEKEIICAEKWMRLIYENPAFGAPLLFFARRKAISRLYGLYCKTRLSAKNIPQFIQNNQVDMAGCKGPYKNFREFFTREKSGITFPDTSHLLGCPCEGMVSAYESIKTDKLISVKGQTYALAELFRDEAMARAYEGGAMFSIRLSPANYHRMHFFDDGAVISQKNINGGLFSVSPLALKKVARLYCRNKRALINFRAKNFGDAVIVEVGATFVGSIVHSFNDGDEVKRGGQASYFLPGGSLVLVLFKKGVIIPDKSLLRETEKGFETKVKIGSIIGEGLKQ